MIKKNIYVIAFASLVVIPNFSFAALEGLKGLITDMQDLLNTIIPVVFGFALVFFFWGMAQFILHADQEDAREDGKKRMVWGIVALFVIVSIYGILNFISNATNIPAGGDLPSTTSTTP